jgi:hypothetical protein
MEQIREVDHFGNVTGHRHADRSDQMSDVGPKGEILAKSRCFPLCLQQRTSPASSDMPGGAKDDKKPASDQPGGLFVANVRSGSERHQRVRRCRLDRLGDDAPDLIRQPLQGLALLADALKLYHFTNARRR